MKLSKQVHVTVERKVTGYTIYYRWGRRGDPSSDQQAIAEVLERRCYRRVRSNFDVMPGDKVLDLGSNIGSFAFYCRLRGAAHVTCYEPDPECFEILKLNAGPNSTLVNAAVTAQSAEFISFSKSKNPQNNYRGTECTVKGYIPVPPVRNVYGGALVGQKFDFVKMDCEGSEGPLIDNWLLPHCSKLVLEYHTSRDADETHLANRVHILCKHFQHVKIPGVFSRVIDYLSEPGADYPKGFPPRFDSLIFCWGPR